MDDNLFRPLIRLVLSLVVLLPTAGIYLMDSHDTSPYRLLVTKTLVPSFLGGFTVFGIVDIANIKLGFLKLSTLEEGLVKGRFV